MAKEGAKRLRRAARKELDVGRLKLLTAGGYVAQAVEAHSRSWFSFARALVAPGTSATDLLKDSVAASIQCLKTGEVVALGLCNTICDGVGERPGKPKMESGVIVFPLDQYTQTTDPFPIDVPLASNGVGVDVALGSQIPPGNIALSVSSEGDTIEVALVRLGVGVERVFPNEGEYTAKLTWTDGSQEIKAVVKFI
jgi:hypothetical protein